MSWSATQLNKMPIAERLKHCPEFLQKLVQSAALMVNVKTVILFGSRARGDHREKSDYDIGLKIDVAFQNKWSQFVNAMQEDLQTLYTLDIVNLDQVDVDLKTKILEQGVVIYEKN